MIRLKAKGNFRKTNSFLERCSNLLKSGKLDYYGRLGIEALSNNTPKDSGKTSRSWEYRIERNSKGTSIIWYNTNMADKVSVAILLQYGHISNGTYVKGIDYINPAMKPIFDKMANDLWREVKQ